MARGKPTPAPHGGDEPKSRPIGNQDPSKRGQQTNIDNARREREAREREGE